MIFKLVNKVCSTVTSIDKKGTGQNDKLKPEQNIHLTNPDTGFDKKCGEGLKLHVLSHKIW
jgi:hypothetical protein